MLAHYLLQFGFLSAQEIEKFARLGKRKQLKKGSFFCREGQRIQQFAFIESGIFRSYFTASKEKAVTYVGIVRKADERQRKRWVNEAYQLGRKMK